MKKVWLALVTATLVAGGASSFAEVKLGVVDVNKVMTDSKQLKDAQQELKNKFTKDENELRGYQKQIQELIAKLQDSKVKLSDKEKADLQKQVAETHKKMQDKQRAYQENLTKEQNNTMGRLVKNLEAVVKKVADAKGISLVLIKAATVYSKDDADITNDVMREMGTPVAPLASILKK